MPRLNDKKPDAIALRKNGLSYNQIASTLGVAKSTLSTWLKSIKVDLDDTAIVQKRSASIKRAHRRKRADRYQRAVGYFSEISLNYNALALVGAALYWAEGARYGGMKFVNSDAHMVLLYMRWLREVLQVREEDITCRVHVHLGNGLTIADITGYWVQLTGIPESRFNTPSVNKVPKSSKKVRHSVHAYGVLSVSLKHPVIYRSALAALLPILGKQTNYVEISPTIKEGEY